jgi:hypothetical protein
MESHDKSWNEQGCAVCREEWLSGSKTSLLLLGTSNEHHAHLHTCQACGSYWEELERYAHQVSASEASKLQESRSWQAA